MLSFPAAIVLGAVQGVTELFPISSLGHSVLLLGILARFGDFWRIDQGANDFLTFLVATHFATALVLFFLYIKDWRRIIAGIFRSLAHREIAPDDADAKLGWLLVVATIPAGIAGVLFEQQVKNIFIAPASAAFFLILNGVLLAVAELFRRRAPRHDDSAPRHDGAAQGADVRQGAETVHDSRDADKRIAAELSWPQTIKIGLLQIIALIPGFSRTGSTLAGGLMVGLSHEDALRFSFLLATPVIGGAALLKLPPLLASHNAHALSVDLVGAIAAAIPAYFSAKYLTRYFKTKTLTPFAMYCLAAGIIGLIAL